MSGRVRIKCQLSVIPKAELLVTTLHYDKGQVQMWVRGLRQWIHPGRWALGDVSAGSSGRMRWMPIQGVLPANCFKVPPRSLLWPCSWPEITEQKMKRKGADEWWEVCTEGSGRGFGQKGVNQNFDSQEASACSTWRTDLFSNTPGKGSGACWNGQPQRDPETPWLSAPISLCTALMLPSSSWIFF